MKNIPQRSHLWLRKLAAIATAAALASCAAVPTDERAGEPRTVIRNVTVIPMDKRGSLAGRDVVVAGGRIVAVARTGSVRARPWDQVIEGSGKYLMPGLWDMHVHATRPEPDAAIATSMPLYLSYGIVGVRDTGALLTDLNKLKQQMARRPELPELIASGPVLDGPAHRWQQKVAMPLADAQAARLAVRELAQAGVDFLKPYETLSPEQYLAIASEAKAVGLPFAGHVPMKITVEQASAAGQKSIEHGGMKLAAECIADGQSAPSAVLNAWIKQGFTGKFEESRRWWAKRDLPACRSLYARLAKRQTWVTPTLSFEIDGGTWTKEEDLADLAPDALKSCRANLELIAAAPAELREAYYAEIFAQVRELHEAGVPLLAGSDVPNGCLSHGRSLHRELRLLRHAGISSWEVLKTATINPARYLGRTDEGVVRAGAKANLLLLDADPLADIENTQKIAGVMLKGRWHDAQALQAMRTEATGRSASAATIYENALVWNGSGFEPRTLAVRDGRFIDAGEAGAAPARKSLGGSFVVPAYANSHTHLTHAYHQGSWAFLKNGVFYAWNPNNVLATDKDRAFFARPDTLDVAFAQGGITEPGGHPERIYVEILAKHVYKGMTLKDFLGNAFNYGRDQGEIGKSLDLLKSQKADFVKAYLLHSEEYAKRKDDPRYYGLKGLNPLNFPYLVAAARQRGLQVLTHVETASDLKLAALSGAAVAAHLPAHAKPASADRLKAATLTAADAAIVARSGMWVVPTYGLAARGFAAAEKEGKLDSQLRAQTYAVQAQNLKLLKAAGAKFLMGTDTEGAIFEEAEHLVGLGAFDTLEALRMVLGTGRRLFPERRIGCFEPGCEADFIVLGADPTRDIKALREIRSLVKAGRELTPPPEQTK